jgi:hypothetical protein
LFPDQQAKRPDFLIAAHDNVQSPFHWVIVEMKTRTVDGGDIERQLRAAIDVINAYTPPTPSNATFTLLVLHAAGRQRVSFEIDSRRPIRIRNGRVKILPLPCGSSLSDVTTS